MLSNDSTTSDKNVNVNDSIVGPGVETNGVSSDSSDGHLSEGNLHVAFDSNFELTESTK